MKYELIEGSEINCTVHLESNGVLDVNPIDEDEPYSFQYFEISEEGRFIETWESLDEDLILSTTMVEELRKAFYDKSHNNAAIDKLKSGSNITNNGFGKK